MTVSTTNSYSQHIAAGGTVFAFDFKIQAEADLTVKTTSPATGIETTRTLTADYTVSAGPWPAGGTVTFVTPPPTGHIVTLLQDIDPDQMTDLVSGGILPPEQVEAALDKVTLIVQRLRDLVLRSAKLPDGSPLSSLELPYPIANNLVGWNDAADALENKVLADLSTTLVTPYIEGLLNKAAAAAARTYLGAGFYGDLIFTSVSPSQVDENLGVDGGSFPFTVPASSFVDVTVPHNGFTDNVVIDWMLIDAAHAFTRYSYSLCRRADGGVRFNSAPSYAGGFTLPAAPAAGNIVFRIADNGAGGWSGNLYWSLRTIN